MKNLNSLELNQLDGSQKQLKAQCDSIALIIQSGAYELESSESSCSAYDYLRDMLDINYIVNSDKSYKGARILVAFGGPNIYIDTLKKEVQGYWGGDSYIAYYSDDTLGIDDYCKEVYNCI